MTTMLKNSRTRALKVAAADNPRARGMRRGTALLRTVGLSAVAAAGMMACAMSPSLLGFIPGFTEWMTSLEEGPLGLPLVAASMAILTVPLLSAAAILAVIVQFTPISWRDILGTRSAGFSATALLGTTAAAAILGAGVIGLLSITGIDADRATEPGTAGVPLALFVLLGLGRAFLLQGIQEELWFRGLAFRGYRDHTWIVLFVTTLAFTALHLTSTGGQQSTAETFLYLVLPLGMGFWSGVERLRTSSVWPAVGVHGGMHTGLIVTALAGWPMGPAAWIAVGSVFIFAGTARLLTRHSR